MLFSVNFNYIVFKTPITLQEDDYKNKNKSDNDNHKPWSKLIGGLGRLVLQQDRKGKIKNSYAMVCIVYL